MKTKTDTAIALGAGIGGLLATGVLSQHFKRVLIIERDRLPTTPIPRMGVPQGPQVHAVMKRGEITIEEILPGFKDQLTAAGGATVRYGLDINIYEGGGWHPNNDLGFTISTQTRALLEQVIRTRLLACGTVEICEGCRFRELVIDGNGQVRGVEFEADARETLSAGLVIDAMGRSSPMPAYLTAHGFGTAPNLNTQIDLSYATILLHVPPARRGELWGCVMRPTAPDLTQGATIIPIEGGRWLLSLASRFGDTLPTKLEECVAFTKSLEVPDIHDRVDGTGLAVAGKRFNIPTTRLSRFDQMDGFPPGLLPLGDVINALNPLFAQGMTIAALHAKLLGDQIAALGPETGALDLKQLGKNYISAATELSLNA